MPVCMGSPALKMVANTGCALNTLLSCMPNGVGISLVSQGNCLLISKAATSAMRSKFLLKRIRSPCISTFLNSDTQLLSRLCCSLKLITISFNCSAKIRDLPNVYFNVSEYSGRLGKLIGLQECKLISIKQALIAQF